MLGKPKFKLGDKVKFDVNFNDGKQTVVGEVAIIDAYGTFEDNSQVYYDISTDKIFFKHIAEEGLEPA